MLRVIGVVISLLVTFFGVVVMIGGLVQQLSPRRETSPYCYTGHQVMTYVPCRTLGKHLTGKA